MLRAHPTASKNYEAAGIDLDRVAASDLKRSD